jgi:hypothetical protein
VGVRRIKSPGGWFAGGVSPIRGGDRGRLSGAGEGEAEQEAENDEVGDEMHSYGLDLDLFEVDMCCLWMKVSK